MLIVWLLSVAYLYFPHSRAVKMFTLSAGTFLALLFYVKILDPHEIHLEVRRGAGKRGEGPAPPFPHHLSAPPGEELPFPSRCKMLP